MKKTLKVLTTSALLASVAAPFAAPVSANSTNTVNSIINVKSDYNSNGTYSTPLTTLEVKQDDTDITSKDTFRVVLPAGVEWDDEITNAGVASKATISKISDQIIEVTPQPTASTLASEKISVPLYVKFDGAEAGEQKLKIEALDSTISSGSYTFAVVGSGSTNAVVDDVKSVGKGWVTGGTIRIDETAVGAVDYGTSGTKVKVKLAPKFQWNETEMEKIESGKYTNVTSGGGFGANAISKVEVIDDRTLEVTLLPGTDKDAAKRGSIYVKPQFKADSDASFNEVTASVSGPEFSDQDVTIAKYADFGGTLTIDTVKDIVAGKLDETDSKTGKVTIEEAVAGSFVAGRDLTLSLPSWVKVVGITDTSKTNFTDVDFDIKKGDKSEVIITPKNTGTLTSSKGKIQFKLQLSVQGDKTGDIEAVIKGSGIAEQKLVIAKAVAPVSIEAATPAKVKIGVQSQDAPDIIITEAVKGAFEKDTEEFTNKDDTTDGSKAVSLTTASGKGEIRVKLPKGVTFAAVPKVEVTEGNLEIKEDNVTRADDNQTLVIPVDSESTKASKIKISGVKLTVDRTVPEGDIKAKLLGSAVVENGGSDAGEFNTDNVIQSVIATTVTPAPTDTTAKNIVFKLNSKTFTVDGKEMEMDAAPLVAWDRAFLPVRFAANALNVSDENIVWDDKTSTATIFKGDRVIVAKVGDKFLTVNGAKVPMDVPVYRSKATQDRVMIPVRYLGNALGATIDWNQETNEITIQAK